MTSPSSYARINLEQCRKQAKELVKAHRAGDRRTLDLLRWNLPRFHQQPDDIIAKGTFVLADAQYVVARTHYFESWPKLLAYVEEMEKANPVVARFEAAADAIVSGDIDTLRTMLDEHPDLIRQRSTRGHQSTLLHYVSANGIENYRQVTPPNILDITRLLLDRGADVDATSEAYGGGSTTLGLASTSAHPRARGVQIELVDLLIEYGAQLDGEDTLKGLVSGALANGCPEAAVALASRGATVNTLYAAAGVGNMERVRTLFAATSPKRRESAMIVAAQMGHIEVVRYFLDHGVDVNASDGMTALHQASAGGYVELMDLLIKRGANLEALNEFGGTVLSSTLWFAYNVHNADFIARNFPRAIDFLIASGARVDFYDELPEEIAGVQRRAERLTST